MCRMHWQPLPSVSSLAFRFKKLKPASRNLPVFTGGGRKKAKRAELLYTMITLIIRPSAVLRSQERKQDGVGVLSASFSRICIRAQEIFMKSSEKHSCCPIS